MPPTEPPNGESPKKDPGKPKTKSGRKGPPSDVVGIEVGAGLAEGAPAVRLRRAPDGALRIAAAGFVPVVSDVASILAMPADMRGPWSLPTAFRAPAAALAVTSPDALVRQSDSVEDATADFDVSTLRTKASATGKKGALPFVAFMPEELAKRVARLLPEGHKPTAVSVQVSPLARVNAFAASPALDAAGGTAVLVQIASNATTIALFARGSVALYRELSVGEEDSLRAVAGPMNVDNATAKELLEGGLVDPAPFLGPLLMPVFRQAELSTDWVLRRNGLVVERFFVAGPPALAPHWTAIFREQTGRDAAVCDPIADFPQEEGAFLPPDFGKVTGLFSAALGAAAAAMQEEEETK
ncbi:MAG: hypothetical protein IJL06_08875 [Kiritimatiellae bacterium]|nr:hypothetical protein [Kiritimatiellia bacterium]